MGINAAQRLCNLAIILALMVILMGGWTRIMDAGLGCPDWPGCFGQLVVPTTAEQIAIAEHRYELVVDQHKGWIEMVHRYLASTLGIVITVLAVIGWRNRKTLRYPVFSSYLLLVLVIAQGMFGMWTVTMKLLPQVVTIHLLGGLLTLTMLIFLSARLKNLTRDTSDRRAYGVLNVALLVLFIQIMLGGWTSANYAGWACNHWFSCTKERSVELDYRSGFSLTFDTTQNYQGGMLPQPARAAIQMTHRVGALITALVIFIAVVTTFSVRACRKPALILTGLLLFQITIGALNAVLGVPVLLALLHHAGAVMMLLCLLWLKRSFEEENCYA